VVSCSLGGWELTKLTINGNTGKKRRDLEEQMFLKMIKTEKDYDQALIELQRLIMSNPEPDSEERNRMEVLSHLVKKYEDENFHFEKSDPIDMIKFIMEQRGLTQ